MSRPRPFLKWVGGKTQLLGELVSRLPGWFPGSYHEPFVGGGALFFELRRQREAKLDAYLQDVNQELIDCYRAVRDHVDELILCLEKHVYKSEYYYEIREQKPSELDLPARAARTIFLNKTGFNGLYRVNGSGRFNVPFGRYTNPTICDPENLRACSYALQGATLTHGDFALVEETASAGDVVYFDPPYVPLSPTSSFTSYVPGGFGEKEQRALAATFARLAERGVFVVLSNSDTPLVRELYRDFAIHMVSARRSVSSKGGGRGSVSEVIVTTGRESAICVAAGSR